MLGKFSPYFKAPVFPGDEDKTFTASLLHIILWSMLVGICLYTLAASFLALIPPDRLVIAWLYVMALAALVIALLVLLRRGYVQLAAIAINVGLWIILTVAAYFNGGVAAPAYSGYVMVIVCTSLLVGWHWGVVLAVASAATGGLFLIAANNHTLPAWASTYSLGAVWGANLAYFAVVTMLLALALRVIRRASQQLRLEMSERLKTEQALSNSEQRFRAIFNSVDDAIFVHDRETGRILDVNQKMCEMYGCSVTQACQLTIGELSAGVPPYTQREALAWMHKAAAEGPQVFEWHAKDCTGRLFWVEVNMRCATIDGQDRLLVVVRDITARKEADQIQAAIRQVAEAALLTPNLAEFYQSVQGIIRPLIPANNFFIALYDAVNDLFTVPYLVDEFDRVWPPYHPGKGLNAYVMRTGEPLLATSAVFSELERQGQVEIIYRPMVEWLGVPLKTSAGILGVMAVQNYSGPARLNDRHKDLLVFVSAQVAMAIERKYAEERERHFSQGLRAVIEAAQDLLDCADLEGLYRRSVELAREKLGLERCALYLLEEQEPFIHGTFGTDHNGQTTDEHLSRDELAHHPEVLALSDRLWVSYERTYTYWQDGSERRLDNQGWNVATSIQSRRRTVGVLYNDAAITRAPLDETQQDIVAVYCSLLGSLLELKRAESELAHERDLLQVLMDNFPDTIYFKDTASRFTRINLAQARLLGVDAPEEAIGKTDADFFRGPGLSQMFLLEEQQLMAGGEPIIDRVEYNPTPDGQPRWLSASKVPLRDAAGQIIGMVGISRNITDRMLAEQREKAISQGLRAVIDTAQELIDCPDLDTLCRRSVELAREKLGLERCGLHLLDEQQHYLLGTYGTDGEGRTTDERQERVPVTERHEVFSTSDGLWTVLDKPYTFVEADTTRVLPESGWIVATPIRSRRQNIGMLYNDTAITHARLNTAQQDIVAVYCSLLGELLALKRTETELAHERDLLQALMDNIPDLIYFKDTASRFTRINQAQARFLGVATPQEAQGKTDLDFQSLDLAQTFMAEEQELIRTGQPIIDRLEHNPTRTGQPRWLASTKVPLRDATGRIYGIAGVSRDVTERLLAQQRDRTISQGLRAAIEAADELMSCGNLDLLYRRAVELAREKLQVERCGLFTLDEQGWLHGTYGTDFQGRTSDERSAYFKPDNLDGLDATYPQRWKVIESYEQAYWENGQPHRAGKGWIGTTFIRARDRVVGVMYNDAAMTHTPLDEAQQEMLAVYCSLLGSLIELKHAEEAVRESEALYRRAIEAAGAVPYYLDYVTESYRFMGEGIQAMTGVPPEEMRPSVWNALLLEASPLGQMHGLAWDEAIHETRAGHITEWRCDYRIRTPAGVERWITDASIQVRDELGQPRGAIGILQDITERKQVELAVQQREAYLRSIFDNFPYWVWLKDTEGRFLAVNQGMVQSRGFEDARDFIGKTDADISPPELAEKYRADDRAVMASRTQKLTEEIVLDQGVEKWFETFKSPIFDAQGQVIGTAGFSHDITARRQAEAAIRESEAMFRQLAEIAPALIALTDEHGAATYLNRAWREFRGETPGLPLEEWSAQIHPDDRERYFSQFRSSLQARSSATFEYRARRADGEYRWLLDTIVPRYAATQQFAGMIGIAIDMTERKTAEEALRRNEAQLRLLTENMADMIFQLDTASQLVYVSPSVEHELGYQATDLLGQRLTAWLHPADQATFDDQLRLALKLQAPMLRLIYRQRHAAGHYLWIESEVQVLYADTGDYAGAVLGSRDISTRRQMEAEREALIKELEQKNTELERFTYTVSHDLKSPLITIRGFLGFLEKDAVAGNFERLHADVGRIADATTRMQRLLDELLSLSRVGRLSNAPQDVPFGVLAHEAVDLVQGRIMARGVRVEIAENLPHVYGDRVRLVEVLQNLIDNAVKFMGDQPEPQITIGALGADRNGLPIFFVQDNGIGIDPAYHERVFGLFNKLDAQTEGTGVGLALVKRIIEVHGGQIWVESDGVGHGTVFLFTLPGAAA